MPYDCDWEERVASIQDPNVDFFQDLAMKTQSISGVGNFSVCPETSAHFCAYDLK